MVKNVKDYVEEVQKRFPTISQSEINKIISFGLRRYAWVNKMHCDVLLKNKEVEPMTAHCGRLGYGALKQYFRWVTKWRMKERVLYRLHKCLWDGYYYIGLTDAKQKAVKTVGGFTTFKLVYLTKIKRELRHNKAIKHIWRVPWPMDCGWKFYREKLRTDKAEYIGKSNYEIYHQCFLGGSSTGLTPADSGEHATN